MYNQTSAFAAEIKRSHRAVSRVEVWSGETRLDIPLYVTGGSVQVDSTAAIRRTCSVTLADPTGALVPDPRTGVGAVSPYGTEMRLFRGVRYSDGTEELMPLGVFRISDNDISDNGDGRAVVVAASDRSRAISRNMLTDEYVIGSGANYVTAIENLLQDRWTGSGDLEIRSTPTSEVSPLVVLETGTDPWEQAQQMAAGIGYELFFDANGVAVLQPVPATDSDPGCTYYEGPDSVLLDVSSSLSDDPGYNGVILTAESTTLAVPLRGEAWDMSTDSPTYSDGLYGKVPFFTSSPYPTTQAAVDAAARAALQKYLGATQKVSFSAIPNPSHEANDVIAIRRLSIGVDDAYSIQACEIPLGVADKMTFTLTQRRVGSA